MDIKAKIEEVLSKIKADPSLAEDFKKDPVKAVEKITGTDLPDDIINPVIDGVKAKLTADNIKNTLGGIFGGKK